ncbi:hypothetical protein [Paracoccus tibetensis]|jgi:hypothetical protein|uniref:17 kDa surface antigen n=1 Tax=Paracoccus tibetensis TaxID=336292 RepID=A0A1G5H857_9RHOB|nr:hypothetical protein [Paracoccus tibetensis]SCY59540.1 hypothetical protein SAMN05660710_02020 [Paracoccus tibetensis]
MSKAFAIAAVLSATALAGCTQNINPTDADRAIIGAATGYTVQTVRGQSGGDRLRGAAIGGAAGALCDDFRLCQ